MSKIIKIGQLFLNLQPIIWVDVFFETRCRKTEH